MLLHKWFLFCMFVALIEGYNMKKYVIILGLLLGVALVSLVYQYKRLNDKYNVSVENIKAYDAELSGLKSENRVFKLTVGQLNYFNDSIIQEMNSVRKELGIKDSKIKQMQYQLSQLHKTDSIILRDTIFRDPLFELDTIVGDKWISTRLGLSYPSLIKLDNSIRLEGFCFIESRRETVNPPKKFFLFRWFQKKHNVAVVTIIERNPYVIERRRKFIEIIK